ncbi:MAG: hypothetical protein WAV46_02660 [Candidatus Moraniibacteriota bacterium]
MRGEGRIDPQSYRKGEKSFSKSFPFPEDGKIIFTDGIAPHVEQSKKTPPSKGDVFENTTSGDRIVVRGVRTQGGEQNVSYIETYSHGGAKNGKKVMEKPLRNFTVLAAVAEMEKIDPIKEKDPELYAAYEEQMEKLAAAFVREFTAVDRLIDAWGESLQETADIDLYDQLYEAMEKITKQWNTLDDRFVEQGRHRMRLFAELRGLEGKMPGDHRAEIMEPKALYADSEFQLGTELVEKIYQNTLLDKKVEALQKKYDRAKAGRIAIASDAPSPVAFAAQVNDLFASIGEASSSEDIKSVLTQLGALEERVFVGEKEAVSGDADKKSHRESKGKWLKRFRDVTVDDKVKPSGKQDGKKIAGTRARGGWTPKDAASEPVALPSAVSVDENGVESKEETTQAMTDTPVASPSVAEYLNNTDTMHPNENPAQPDSKKQEFLDAFAQTFEDLKVKISGAENMKALKDLKRGGRDARYMFFDLDNFAEYLNHLNGKSKEEERRETFDKIVAADKELDKLCRARKRQLGEVVSKQTGVTGRPTKESGERAARREGKKLSNEEVFAQLTGTLKVGRIFKKDGEPLLIIRSVTSEGIDIEFRNDTKDTEWKHGKIGPKQASVFWQQLETSFGWTGEKASIRKARTAKPPFQQPMPVDIDEAVREAHNKDALTDEERKHQKKVGAEKVKSKQASFANKETAKERATKELAELRAVIEEKKKWTQDFFADPANAGLVTQESLDNLINYLDKLRTDSESAVADGRHKRVSYALKEAREAKFMPEEPKQEPAVSASAEQLQTPERTYEALYTEAEKSGYSYTLIGALASGIRTMKETSPELAAQKAKYQQQIADALIDNMEDTFKVTGEKLGWSAAEKKIFIAEIVASSIEKFL